MDYSVKKLLSPYIYNDIATIYSKESFACFRNKTVFITGAGSSLGRYLAYAFLMGNDMDSNNTKVILYDREESLFEKYGNLNSRTDIDFLVSKTFSNMPREKADYIIHTDCKGNKDYFEAMGNLLSYALQNENTTVVLCSDMHICGSVYNGKSKLSEDDMGYLDLSNADNYTLQSQRMVEAYGKKLASEKELNIKFARVCSVLSALGKSPLNELAVSAVSDKNNAVEFITDNADIIQSYCYVTDAVTALLKILIDGKAGEVYNVSSGYDTSMKYITEVCQQLYPNINVAYKNNGISNNYDISPMSSTRLILDNSKLLSLGFTPKVSLADSIKRTVNIIQENL